MAIHAPYDLAIDFGGDTFPVSGSHPRLSWKPSVNGPVPAGHELDLRVEGRCAQTFQPPVHEHLFVDWPARALRSRERVRWRVRTQTGAGFSPWSAWHAFEAGLFDEDWTAHWITPEDAPHDARCSPGSRPARILRTTFTSPEDLRRARLYATALGVYEVFINGERVGATELAPGSSSYDRTVYAQAADAAPYMRVGRNTIEIVLSDGWYRGQVGAFRIPADWGELLAARLELHLDLMDGSHQVVRTDGHWTSTLSLITRADLMEGQSVDLAAPEAPELGVLVDAITAPPTIDWSPAPPVRRIESRPPVSVAQLPGGAWIADFGQNASGWLRVTDLGPAGTRTVIEHGEHLDPATGDLTTTHLDTTRPEDGAPVPFIQRDEVVSSGTAGEVFEPRHTVHGFRYARLHRGPDAAAPPLTGITMQVVHSDLRPTASFACGNEDLNRLHEAVRWSFRGNAVDVPTDCPTRERIGWTGDYQVFASTAALLYDVSGFSRKWLRSVREDQLDDGRIANFSPDGRRTKRHLDDRLAKMTGSAGWGDAIVLVPWTLYEMYGDRGVLAENFDAAVRWVEWALATAKAARHPSRVKRSAVPLPHEEFVWDGSFHWGEWGEPKPRAANGTPIDTRKQDRAAWQKRDNGEVGTAFLRRSTAVLADTAHVLGRAEEAARYGELSERVKDAWRTEFLDPATSRTTVDTQASHVRALAFDLIPDKHREAVASRLVELVRAAGGHLGTGFLATADLLPVLADTGYADVAYEVLLQRTPPSWLAMLDRGATTVWEDWDGVDEHGAPHESLNHYSKGAVIRFLYTHTLGLRQALGSVAWESFVVAPVPHPSVNWARGSYDGPRGTITVEWRSTDDAMEIAVDVPPASTATVVFPDGEEIKAGPGRFTACRTVVESTRRIS
ncbi:family 78 glycoside hydrolase catalytic domain [Streptomyces sp. 8P21H-1]|uniref:family 78 glycoside hydrolase catalytic domain n=1 Tax=Streptomyces sp. 8P21H-1 TaxID=2737048 RepID=UPI001C2D8075|nr:family 78 glycoside hydrolase catalytic domain [Streptomyces sp. 8P21H-1]